MSTPLTRDGFERFRVDLPDPCLVVLVGASGSGKSTFARTHFGATEIVSSDACRGYVCNDESSLEATKDAFELLQYWVGIRLKRGILTVVDATSVQRESRASLIALARRHHALSVAIVLDMPDRVCEQRNAERPDRDFGAHVIKRQNRQLRQSIRQIRREGFHSVYILRGPEDVERVEIARKPLWVDRRTETGPFDIIGDIHGCLDETLELLGRLGYDVVVEAAADGGRRFRVSHADERTVVFLGDLTDRGPDSPGVLRLVMDMVDDEIAICLPGNHDDKLLRYLKGRNVQLTHGLAETVEQLAHEADGFGNRVKAFLDGLVSHAVFDSGTLVVAHAGMPAEYQGRASRTVREFALYGESTGETDDLGRPVRVNWAATYRGDATVVYGHTAVERLEWLNRTIDIDTGCVFGGALTALRYPEMDLVSVPAHRPYCDRPDFFFGRDNRVETQTAQQRSDDTLDYADFAGKLRIQTRLMGTVRVSEEQGQAALEILSRFAIDPKWLIYLPPTMSPVETATSGKYLEHPDQAWDFYRANGVQTVVCQEKHMGSRAIAVVCRDAESARTRFGVTDGKQGAIYTRTGRSFLNVDFEAAIVQRLAHAMSSCEIWTELETSWICIDAEIMPWSYKARELIQQQYAATFAAGFAALEPAVSLLKATAIRGIDVAEVLAQTQSRLENLTAYRDAYMKYSWPVSTIDDLRFAPFHFLASEGKVHVDRSHTWHMEQAARLASIAPEWIIATTGMIVDLADDTETNEATDWWSQLTDRGGEGMVVKPANFLVPGKRGPVQPAVKVRGREYLRIIYGPEYTAADQIERLRSRGLGTKRMNALREFALGIESLERFVGREPLYRVHECVVGVLALESEPIDPRL